MILHDITNLVPDQFTDSISTVPCTLINRNNNYSAQVLFNVRDRWGKRVFE